MAVLTAAAALGLAVMGVSAESASFTLVDGASRVVIAIPANPSASERLGAEEIATYVERMSGVRLAVQETSDPPAGAIVISTDVSGKLGDEGYSMEAKGGRLYLTAARGRSVLYAAYDLLGRLGCRWLAPGFAYYGDSAEIVPKSTEIVLALGSDVVETPRLALRKLYVEEGLSHDAENLRQLVEWMAKSRFNVLVVPTDYQGTGRVKWDTWREALTPELRKRDILIEVGGHGYQNFLNAEMEDGKLFEQHPEWFGMAEGKRVRAHERVFCSSNAAAVEYLTKNVLAYLAAHPEIDIFDFWPPDGAKWCECEACAKLGFPQDRQSLLVNHVIAEAAKRELKARFETIAYASAIDPPTNPPMDKSVLIDFCPIAQCFEVQIYDPASEVNAKYVAQLVGWLKAFSGDISIYSYYRKYAWRSMPVIIPHYMQADIRWYEQQGADGISCYSEPGDWRTYELNHYTLARLAWNPTADVDAIVHEFCGARFGKSASKAQELYRVMEEVVRKGCRIPGTSLKSPAELDQFAKQLRAAKDALLAESGDSKAAAALAATVDYALRSLALQKSKTDNADEAGRAKMVDELIAFFDSHKGEGLFLDERRVSRQRLIEDYK